MEDSKSLIAQMTLEEKAGSLFITMAAVESDGALAERASVFNPVSLGFEMNSDLVVVKKLSHLNTLQSPSPEDLGK